MKIIEASAEFIGAIDGAEVLRGIERAGRVCYQSGGKVTDDSAPVFVRKVIERGHEAVLEHACLTARFIVDRGVSHEIVRHRLAAYCQESTRYCDYSADKFGRELTFIRPCFFQEGSERLQVWIGLCECAEAVYIALLEAGATPQEARAVLPASAKTELIMTADLREWRHFFRLRCAPDAHPQMRQVVVPLLAKARELVPVVFEDISV